MKRHLANLLILALVFFVAVALINLFQNLQALAAGGSPGPSTRIGFGIPTFGLNPLLLAWIVALAGISIFLVVFLYARPRGGRLGLEELLPLVVGAVVLVSILFLQDWQERDAQLAEEEEEAGGTGTGGAPPQEEPPPLEFLRGGLQSSPGLMLLLGSFIAFAAIYFLVVLLQARRGRALGLSIQRKQALKREMAEALEDRIYRLRLGEDMRSLVLGAYRDMMHLFASYGIQAQKHQTAREVEAMALEKLGLSGKASRSLRRLFEEARYSFHVLTEEQRQSAIESLQRVKRELGA